MTLKSMKMRTPRFIAVILLAAVAAAAIPTSGLGGQAPQTAAPLRFNVVSIKPSLPGDAMVADTPQRGGYWVVRAVPVAWLIYVTFETQPNLVLGMPAWAKRKRYSIEARMPPSTTDAQLHMMLQSMLRDRFDMAWHTAMREEEVAVLRSAGAPGPGLRQASGHCLPPGAAIPPNSSEYTCGVLHVSPGPSGVEFSGSSVTLGALATFFTRLRLTPVIAPAGANALYDIDVTISIPSPYPGQTPEERTLDYEKAIQTAVKKQLGLDLDMAKPVKLSVPVLVIDRLEPATAN